MASLDDRVFRARVVRGCIMWSPAGFALAFVIAWLQGAGLGLSAFLGAVLMAGCLLAAAIIAVLGRHSWIALIVIAVGLKLIAASL